MISRESDVSTNLKFLNDVRKLENMNPIEGDEGDKYFMPLNIAELGSNSGNGDKNSDKTKDGDGDADKTAE